MTGYSEAASRFSRWLRKYRRDRTAHAQARRMHSDPAILDAEFAQVVRGMRLYLGQTKPTELRVATDLLLKGARAHPDHFRDYELSRNFGDLVDVIQDLSLIHI